MRATAEIIEGNRVKVSVEVPEEELELAEEETLKRLQREARVPGFRPGKVPRRLLMQRLGPKALRDELLRERLADYYQSAIDDTELDAISAPEIDITAGEESGPLSFDAVVEVRPKVSIAGYEGLVVTIPPLEASDEEVESDIDRLRDQFGTLQEVGRPAIDRDHLTLNVSATRDGEPVEGLSADDFVYELGSDGLVPGADEALRGAKPGDIFDLDVPDARGGPAQVRILVKEVREKMVPAADDAWAEEASEFETIEELRSDLRTRITDLKRRRARAVLPELAVDALAELVGDDMPETLVNRDLERRMGELNAYLEARGIGFDVYCEATGKTAEDVIAELTTAAGAAVRADLALRALVATEEMEVSDEDVEAEIIAMADRQRKSPREVVRGLERSGQLPELRSEMRKAKAVTWLVEHVGVVDDQGNPVDRTALFDDGGEGDGSAGSPEGGPEDSAEVELVEAEV
jgi:trigger factor